MPRSVVAAKKVEPEPANSGSRSLNDEDASLLARTAEGDANAYRRLVERHVGMVLSVARRMLHDDAEAEDVAQEALMRIWRAKAGLVLGPHGLRPWLRRVVSNLCIDRVRASRRVVLVDEVPEDVESGDHATDMETKELGERVDAALKQLPERQRLALVLFHFEGLSHVEIGDEMAVSAEAVESLLARGRRTLKQALKDEWRDLAGRDSR